MGQQQILLVILASILVGIAIFAALNIYKSEADSVAFDQYQDIALEMTSEIQKMVREPVAMGGTSNSFSETILNFDIITCPWSLWNGNKNICHNEESIDYARLTLTGHSNDHVDLELGMITRADPNNSWNAAPEGAELYRIRWRITRSSVTVVNELSVSEI